MPTDDQNSDPIDDLARRAGAELRRPAPEDGLAGVHRSHRRRRTATAAGAAAALVVIAGGTIALANRGGDDDVVVTEDRSIPFDPSVSLGDLSGTWWLTELNGEMVDSDPDAEEAPWVVITEERLTGYFGCNWVDANAPDLGVVDGRLVASFSQSARGCDDEEQQATELALKELLRSSPQVGIDGDTLRWSGAGHVASFARSVDGRLPSPFSSTTTSTTIAADAITGTWWLIAIDGEPIEFGVDAVAQPWITVGDGDMSGFLGCNGFSVADASYAGARLIVDVETFFREQKGCGGVAGDLGPMRTENVLGDLIEAGPTVSIAGENMFWSDGEQFAAFERAPAGWSPATTEPVTTEPTTTTIADVDATGTWWLTEIDTGSVQLGVDADALVQPWVTIEDDRIVGSLGCNTIEVSGVVTVGNRWAIDSSSFVVGATVPPGAPDDTDCGAVHSQRSMVDVLSAGPIVSVAAGTMRWRVNGRLLAFVESPDGSVPSGTVTTTTVAPPSPQPGIADGVAVSDEVLPDPMAFAADGLERVLVDRTITVRGNPDVVIPIDVPESDLWLLGVGPNGVAYLRADRPSADDDTPSMRYIAVPTTGPTIGAVYELLAPRPVQGPWLGWLTPDGIRSYDFSQVIPYVDPNGVPLADPIDPTITWSLSYVTVNDDPSFIRAVVTEVATGRSFEAPVVESSRERVDPSAIRPLPDGRIVVWALVESSTDDLLVTPALMAFDPATETWTQHPAE